jgi:hypothetical protein
MESKPMDRLARPDEENDLGAREIGSYFPGHWVEEGSSKAVAGSKVSYMRLESIRKMQDHGDR